MSAVLPRSKSAGTPGKVSKSSSEAKCKKKTQMSSGSLQHSLSGKSAAELSRGDHPWSGIGEALLRPLPPDWRYNIQKAFSDFGEALGKLMGGAQQEGRKMGGRRRGF